MFSRFILFVCHRPMSALSTAAGAAQKAAAAAVLGSCVEQCSNGYSGYAAAASEGGYHDPPPSLARACVGVRLYTTVRRREPEQSFNM
jgi:hypothetical protein